MPGEARLEAVESGLAPTTPGWLSVKPPRWNELAWADEDS